MAQTAANLVPSLLTDPFSVTSNGNTLSSNKTHVSTPAEMDWKRPVDPEFDEYCYAIRTVAEATAHDEALAEAIAVMLNRAHAFASGQLDRA